MEIQLRLDIERPDSRVKTEEFVFGVSAASGRTFCCTDDDDDHHHHHHDVCNGADHRTVVSNQQRLVRCGVVSCYLAVYRPSAVATSLRYIRAATTEIAYSD